MTDETTEPAVDAPEAVREERTDAVTALTAPPPGWANPLRDPRDRRLPRIAGPSGLVIFGVTGDLSRRKLMPAVYDLANRGRVDGRRGVCGVGRREVRSA
ncbi:glucose-6-phosphate dehydrogenase, partial [Streptomyces cellulosae]